MNFVDVTLRDGGHQIGFHWPLEFVSEHIEILNQFKEIKYIELGYWKQKDKHDGLFYTIDEKLLEKVCPSHIGNKFCFMIDYHYCSHNLEDYPKKEEFPQIDLIRMTSRDVDIEKAISFIVKLKHYTNYKVSLNIFNVTNYTLEQLFNICELCKDQDIEFIYFADTHGNLDLGNSIKEYKSLAEKIVEIGKKPGFHLHDHSGKAYFNFRFLEKIGFNYTDVSLNGIGKGMGNLKFENCIDISQNPKILDFIERNSELLNMNNTTYGLVSGKFSITDHYALEAESQKISPSDFFDSAKNISGSDKDVYIPKLLNNSK